MNAQFKATNPDAIECTVTITGYLYEWREVKKSIMTLGPDHPQIVIDMLNDMISQAERTYYPEVVEK